MAFELDALVGHLYIFGGRSISVAPPGSLVEVAPMKAARGRETDTFFTLVLPSGDTAPTSFYQQMASLSSEQFFKSAGSVTSAIRSVFNTLNQNLYEHNQGKGRHYEASIIIAVLHDDDLYIGRVGPALAMLRVDGQTATFPDDWHNDEALFKAPLGVQPVPDAKISRYRINKGTRLLLADVNFAELSEERVEQALLGQTLETVLEDLKGIVTMQTQLMGVEFIPADDPVPVPVAVGESSPEIGAQIAEARRQVAKTAEMEALAPKKNRRTNALQQNAQKGLGNTFQKAADGASFLSKVVDGIFPPREDGESRISKGMISIAVFAIPITLIAVVLLFWVLNTGLTEFEICINNMNDGADFASSVDVSDVQGVLAAWQATLQIVEECEELRPNDPTVAEVRENAQSLIDALNNITRRQAIPIDSFPDATISKLLLQGLDLYALDSANNLVYRVKLGDDGRSAVSREVLPLMRQGATVDGLVVGNIIDIDFDSIRNEIVLLDDDGTFVRCDPRIIMECDAQTVLATELWRNPVAIDIWEGRLYVLDAGGGQLWRYDPSGNSYGSNPTEYFSGTTRPTLDTVVDFDISSSGSTNGAVFLMQAEGVMTKYFGGTPEGFSFSEFPSGQDSLDVATAQGMFLNDSPIDPSFYIISRGARTIYKTTLSGTYVSTYRVFNENNLALMTDVVADPGQRLIYVSSGNTIFAIDIAN